MGRHYNMEIGLVFLFSFYRKSLTLDFDLNIWEVLNYDVSRVLVSRPRISATFTLSRIARSISLSLVLTNKTLCCFFQDLGVAMLLLQKFRQVRLHKSVFFSLRTFILRYFWKSISFFFSLLLLCSVIIANIFSLSVSSFTQIINCTKSFWKYFETRIRFWYNMCRVSWQKTLQKFC